MNKLKTLLEIIALLLKLVKVFFSKWFQNGVGFGSAPKPPPPFDMIDREGKRINELQGIEKTRLLTATLEEAKKVNRQIPEPKLTKKQKITLTVAELKLQLNKYPDDLPVYARWEGQRVAIIGENFLSDANGLDIHVDDY